MKFPMQWGLLLFVLSGGCWRSVPVSGDGGEDGKDRDEAGYEERFPGPCVRVEQREGRDPTEWCEFQYDGQERVSVIECDEDPFGALDGIIDESITYDYGEGDTPRKVVTQLHDDGTMVIDVYDGDGNPVESTVRYSDGTLLTETCTYEPLDTLHVVRSCRAAGLFEEEGQDRTVFEYDGAGRLVLEEWDLRGDGTVNTRTVYTYDDNNHLVSEESFFADSEGEMNDLSDFRIRYTYDEAGNLLDEIHDSGTQAQKQNASVQITSHYRFYYDCFGN